jgi:hypothetical protein
MPERPYSRYTRAKTWAALYSQHLLAGYAIVPYSLTQNSVDLIPCGSPREARDKMEELLAQAETCANFYALEDIPTLELVERQRAQLPEGEEIRLSPLSELIWRQRPPILRQAIHAVVLARSSDFHHYHLQDDEVQFKLVVCGQHDSYLLRLCWETMSNTVYKARETAVALDSPQFLELRKREYGHNILIGALVCGDKTAIAIRDSKDLPKRTRRRLKSEVQQLQHKRYWGRPLAFMTLEERKIVGTKISDGLQRYYAQKRLGATS